MLFRSDLDPAVALVASALSLETLYLEEAHLVRCSVIYPNLTTLEIYLSGWRTSLRSLVHSFPNLRHLILEDGDPDPSEKESLRQKNHLAASGRSYPRLDYLCGTADTVYALGLTCPIRCLRFKTSEDTALLIDDSCLATMLRAADPTILEFGFIYSRDVSFSEVAFRACFTVPMPKLSHLRIHILFDEVPDIIYSETLLVRYFLSSSTRRIDKFSA